LPTSFGQTLCINFISIYLGLFLFVQKVKKCNAAITYSGQDSKTTVVLNTALNK